MIRKMELRDKSAYIEMSKQFYNSDAVLHSIPVENFEKTFNYILSDKPYVEGYMYEHHGVVAGYVLLSITYSNEHGGLVLLIEEVYIKSKYRRKGFGNKLFRFLENRYNEKVVMMRLEVEEENKGATKLYQNLGFKSIPYHQMYKKTPKTKKKGF